MKQDSIWAYWQNEGSSTFDGSLPRLRFLAEKLPKGARVLNIGIGNATLERLAIEGGVDIWTVDPSDMAIESAIQKLKLESRAFVARVEALPFEDNFFDMVVMSEVIEHLDVPVLKAGLDEIVRVLRPNGKFIGTVPANEDLSASLVVCPDCDHRFHRWGHVQSFTEGSLSSALKQNFDTVHVKNIFIGENLKDGFVQAIAGKIKSILSYYRLGTYGVARNLYFEAAC